MAQTIKLAAQVGAGNSGAIAVGATPVVVSLFADDGVISEGVRCPITRLVDGNQQPVPYNGGALALSKHLQEITLYAPGSYLATKDVTTEAMGFAIDEV